MEPSPTRGRSPFRIGTSMPTAGRSQQSEMLQRFLWSVALLPVIAAQEVGSLNSQEFVIVALICGAAVLIIIFIWCYFCCSVYKTRQDYQRFKKRIDQNTAYMFRERLRQHQQSLHARRDRRADYSRLTEEHTTVSQPSKLEDRRFQRTVLSELARTPSMEFQQSLTAYQGTRSPPTSTPLNISAVSSSRSPDPSGITVITTTRSPTSPNLRTNTSSSSLTASHNISAHEARLPHSSSFETGVPYSQSAANIPRPQGRYNNPPLHMQHTGQQGQFPSSTPSPRDGRSGPQAQPFGYSHSSESSGRPRLSMQPFSSSPYQPSSEPNRRPTPPTSSSPYQPSSEPNRRPTPPTSSSPYHPSSEPHRRPTPPTSSSPYQPSSELNGRPTPPTSSSPYQPSSEPNRRPTPPTSSSPYQPSSEPYGLRSISEFEEMDVRPEPPPRYSHLFPHDGDREWRSREKGLGPRSDLSGRGDSPLSRSQPVMPFSFGSPAEGPRRKQAGKGKDKHHWWRRPSPSDRTAYGSPEFSQLSSWPQLT